MECPYLRNVTFQKIIKVQEQVDEGMFTFSALPLDCPVDETEDNEFSEASVQGGRHNIEDYRMSLKAMQLTSINLPSPNEGMRLLEPESTNELLRSKSHGFPHCTLLKPVNINDYHNYSKSILKLHLDMRIFDIQNLNNLGMISKTKCEVVIQSELIQISTQNKEAYSFCLKQLKLTHHNSLGVLAQFPNIGLLFEINTQEQKLFFVTLKQHSQCSINPTSLIPQHKQSTTLTLTQLIGKANTFDILLYQNNRFLSQVQRLITNSQYDHVSIILKSYTKEAYVLDCNSSTGVTLIPLDRYKCFIDKTNPFKMYYRKFNGNILQPNIAKLQEFINSSIGKKYSFSASYFLSGTVKTDDDTYFCSELIAKVLQHVGLMKQTKSPFRYLPKHFGQKELDLINCSYAQACEIAFS